ncbi:hypothetical protein RUM44_003399 [Polyplax serrata]|uniref:Uncharacterized protein n=1 Tax=Polyplax serrata TaxID=468196 RepID=A0ABR1AGC7_POLSC
MTERNIFYLWLTNGTGLREQEGWDSKKKTQKKEQSLGKEGCQRKKVLAEKKETRNWITRSLPDVIECLYAFFSKSDHFSGVSSCFQFSQRKSQKLQKSIEQNSRPQENA